MRSVAEAVDTGLADAGLAAAEPLVAVAAGLPRAFRTVSARGELC